MHVGLTCQAGEQGCRLAVKRLKSSAFLVLKHVWTGDTVMRQVMHHAKVKRELFVGEAFKQSEHVAARLARFLSGDKEIAVFDATCNALHFHEFTLGVAFEESGKLRLANRCENGHKVRTRDEERESRVRIGWSFFYAAASKIHDRLAFFFVWGKASAVVKVKNGVHYRLRIVDHLNQMHVIRRDEAAAHELFLDPAQKTFPES